ncbi:GNAT family N-acetyltransferase [Synechococcus sp. MU1644]|nr:GNAT family N-acetyltransferase [Synechococcus sp. MU1644]
MPASRLMTERLALDPLTVDDSGFVKRLVRNPRVRAYLGGVVPADQLDGIVRKYLELRRDGHVWLAKFGGNIAVGSVFVTPHHDGAAPELFFQFDPRYWGKG